MYWKVSVQPAAEPVSLAEAKAQLRVDSDNLASDQETLLSACVTAARRVAELWTHRALVEQTQQVFFDYQWPGGPILLPNPPLRSVTAVQYVDGDGVTRTLDEDQYLVDANSEPGRVDRAYEVIWPTPRWQLGCGWITFVAGYEPGSGSPTDYGANVPEEYKAGIKMLAAHLFENRLPLNIGNIVNELPFTVRTLFDIDRMWSVPR